VVIALVQRLGPSTGGATQGAQGDVLFAEFCTSGGYTIPIYAPSTPKECFEATTAAMYWAEKLRTPVVILSDKEIGMMAEDIDFNSLRSYSINERTLFTNGSPEQHQYNSYEFASAEDIPSFAPVGGDYKTTVTGSAHDKKGTLQKNSPETIDVLRHLQEKIDAHAAEMSILKLDDQDNADILLISFGITARTSADAVKAARLAGKRIRFLNVVSLFPVPEYHLIYAAKGTYTVLVAEENFSGQYRSVIRHLFPDKDVKGINSLGRMITPQDIMEAMP